MFKNVCNSERESSHNLHNFSQDVSTNLDIISKNLQQFNFHLGEGFKIFSKCLHTLNEDLCSKVRLNLQELISCSHTFMKGLDILIILQTRVRNAYTKSFQSQEFCQFLVEMLNDLKSLQLHYEEG